MSNNTIYVLFFNLLVLIEYTMSRIVTFDMISTKSEKLTLERNPHPKSSYHHAAALMKTLFHLTCTYIVNKLQEYIFFQKDS